MIAPVLVGSSDKGLWVDFVGGDYAEIRLHGDGMNATARVYVFTAEGLDGLADYFDALNEHWRGWDGERTWQSLEGELDLTAHHDGHVQLAVRLRDSVHANWSVLTTLTLDAGEQLAGTAKDLRQLLG